VPAAGRLSVSQIYNRLYAYIMSLEANKDSHIGAVKRWFSGSKTNIPNDEGKLLITAINIYLLFTILLIISVYHFL
jgi:hypothetical protein